MPDIKRAVIITIDGLGIGELPDAPEYNDKGAHTLDNASNATGGLQVPNLKAMGLGMIEGVKTIGGVPAPKASYGRMREVSKGKDTTTGHWEISGVVLKEPFPTFPEGLPQDMLDRFSRETGYGWLWGMPASGSEIIERLGEEHLATGRLIVYTSADSVFQIAAHEAKVPVTELYRVCGSARRMLDEYRVCRVIARPFSGKAGGFKRTAQRRDFSIEPTGVTLLDRVKAKGMDVIAIGKIGDIFCHRGISKEVHTKDDLEGIKETIRAINDMNGAGVVFTNLVDLDTMYGHRNDANGFKKALESIDERVPEVLASLKENDIIFITADHGCDPTTPSTDHSREYVPLLVYGPKMKNGAGLGTREGFSDISATIAEFLGIGSNGTGRSFLKQVLC
jgi:phosphopentomutase